MRHTASVVFFTTLTTLQCLSGLVGMCGINALFMITCSLNKENHCCIILVTTMINFSTNIDKAKKENMILKEQSFW